MASKPAKSRSNSRVPGCSSIVILVPLLTPPTLVQLNLLFLVPTSGFSTSALCTLHWQVRSPWLQVYVLHWPKLLVSQVCEGPFGFRSFAEAAPSTWKAPLPPIPFSHLWAPSPGRSISLNSSSPLLYSNHDKFRLSPRWSGRIHEDGASFWFCLPLLPQSLAPHLTN